jgi:CSLREA domain-containing protein
MIGTATPKVTWVGRARTLTFFLLALLVAALLDVFLVAPKPAQAATITVGTAADDTTVNANCTLREAITAANTNAAVDACASGAAGADTISFNIPTTDPGFNSTTGVFTISRPREGCRR